MTDTTAASPSAPPTSRRWRVVDIVVASVLGVASGVVFWVWGLVHDGLTDPLGLLLPGLPALFYGFWLFAGVLTALVVRKPGAALYGELLAAVVSALLGTQWGWWTLVSGITQGLGAELVFALLLYRRWGLGAALLAGAGAGLAMAITDLTLWYPGSAPLFATIYTVAAIVGGALIAGLLSWLAVRALARAGALSRFAAGRDLRTAA